MTYEELKNRLSKCELSLEKIKNGTVNLSNTKDFESKKEKLQILKESLTKQIKEAEETMFVSTKGGDTKAVKMSTKNAMDLKSDPNITSIDTAKGKTIKERLKDNKGVKFSIDETKSIAKSVGKAVAISLKSLGDEVAHMKAKNIEENSFEIYVEYKNNSSDQFSFYITDDSLHLVDFSFDKEISDVGVKPSGEAVVNVDVLANELVKHFRAANEMKNPGYASSSQRNQYAQRGGVKLSKKGKEDLNKRMKDFSQRLKDKGIVEAPEGMYYIKISKDAASQNKAQVIFNDLHDVKYELNDDPDGVIMYFKKEDFDAGIMDDLEGDGVQILDTNIPDVNEDAEEDAKNDADYAQGWHDDPRQDEDTDVGHQDDEPNMLGASAMETAEYAAKLVKKLQRYDQHDGEVDFPNWWQKKLILAREYISAAYHYLDSEEKQPAIDQLALESKVNEAMSSEQREAIYDLQNILDRAAQLGDEARQIVKDNFPNELRAGEAYDVFSFGTSSNSYDKTLETLISDIERTAEEEEDMDMDEGRNVDDLYDTTVHTMKRLAKKYKEGDKSVVPHLKKLTDIKKKLEQEKIKKASNIGKGQELSENEIEDAGYETDKGREAYYDVKELIQKHARRLNDDDAYTMHELLKDFFNRLLEATKDIEEAGPGFAHDCAAKVVHETYGKGNTIPEKHTLVKEGKKYVVTHYDVLFESGKTVEDIPVSELQIKTQTEHWHKGYKKKKK